MDIIYSENIVVIILFLCFIALITCAAVIFGPREIKLFIKSLYDRRWRIKHLFHRILGRLFPSYYQSKSVLTESVSVVPKVNCQAVVIIENLPKCTTAKDLIKCLGLKEIVQRKKITLSVAADKKGSCAGLAVAVAPRYLLHNSGMLGKNNSVYQGNVIKVKEVKNRKISLKKQVNWLSSDNHYHVGFRGRFHVYHNVLQDVTTQFGYYLIDGGCYIQFSGVGDVYDIIDSAASSGVDRIVMKLKNMDQFLSSEIAWCKNYPGYLYTTVGIGAEVIKETDDSSHHYSEIFKQLENPINNKFIVAVGECGIVSQVAKEKLPSLDKQIDFFKSQVKLANHFRKPLLVVSNRVHKVLEILDEYPDVTACLTLDKYIPDDESIMKWTNKGHFLGITGSVWANEKENFWIPGILKKVPLDKIILCSNSPYLDGHKSKKERNFISDIKNSEDFKNVNKEFLALYEHSELDFAMEPCWLGIMLELLASCLNRAPIGLAHVLNSNAENFYKFEALNRA